MNENFSALLSVSGLSQRECAVFLNTKSCTVNHWVSGRRKVPDGIVLQMRALVLAQVRMAIAHQEELCTPIVDDYFPEETTICLPSNDETARAYGLPTGSACLAMAGLMLALLPEDIAARVRIEN
jgi:hypothetical protein